jgi:hypothetical protein
MIPINIDLSRISQGNTKLKLGGLDNLSKLDNRIKSDISVYYFSVLIELKISFSYLSAPEIKSSKVELIVFSFDKAHKIVLFFSKFVFEKSVKLALIAYSVSCDLVWSEFVIGCSSLIHPNIDINDFNFVVITNIEVGVAYSKMFEGFIIEEIFDPKGTSIFCHVYNVDPFRASFFRMKPKHEMFSKDIP